MNHTQVLDVTDVKSVSNNPLFTSLHTLLMAIYRRDCRRTFCPDSHWLAKLSILIVFLFEYRDAKQKNILLFEKKK